MKRPGEHWDGWVGLAFAILAAIGLACLNGCTKREESQHREEQSKTVEKETTTHQRHVVLPDGQIVPVVEVTTRYREQVTEAQADTEIRSQTTFVPPPIVSAAIGVASAAAQSTPWGAILTTITTAAATGLAGYAAVQRQRASEHKSDAAQGWDEAMKNAKAMPPPPTGA